MTTQEALTSLAGQNLSKTITFDGTSKKGGLAATATLTTALTGTNNDLTFTAVSTGDDGANAITIAYVNPGTNNAALSVSVSAKAITVNLATNGSAVITSTAAQVDAAIDALPAAAALVTPANAGGNDGTGVVTAMAATNLAGGVTVAVPLFRVSGLVRAKVIARCTTNLAGASATLEVGTPLSTAGLIALTTATDIDANELWHDATPDASTELSSVMTEKLLSQSIQALPKTAAITGGVIQFVCVWSPVSDDGYVTVA